MRYHWSMFARDNPTKSSFPDSVYAPDHGFGFGSRLFDNDGKEIDLRVVFCDLETGEVIHVPDSQDYQDGEIVTKREVFNPPLRLESP